MGSPEDESVEEAAGTEEPGGAESLHERASALAQEGRYGEAEPLYRKNAALVKKALGADHPNYGASIYELSRVLQAQGKHAEAEAQLRKAVALFERTPGVEHPPYAQALHTLAGVLGAQDKFSEVEELLRGALATQEKALGAEHVSLSGTLTNLAIALVQEQRLAEAEPLVERSLRIAEATHGPTHAETARILTIAAQIQAALGRDDAPATAKRALVALIATHGEEHPLVQDVEPMLREIAEPSDDLDALLEQGAEALEARDAPRAIALLTPVADRAHAEGILPLEASANGMLAQALFVTGRKEEALTRARRALTIAEEAGQADAAGHFRELVETMEGLEAGTAVPDAFHAQIEAALKQARDGDPRAAASALERLAGEAKQAGAPGPEATARVLIGQILHTIGEKDRAAAELARALEIAETVGDEAAAAHIRQILGQFGAS